MDGALLTATDTEAEPLLEAAIFTRRGSYCGSLPFEASFMRDILRSTDMKDIALTHSGIAGSL